MYPLTSPMGVGGECIAAAAKDFAHDLPAMRAAVCALTRIVWIRNPNNPTGTAGELQALLPVAARCDRGAG